MKTSSPACVSFPGRIPGPRGPDAHSTGRDGTMRTTWWKGRGRRTAGGMLVLVAGLAAPGSELAAQQPQAPPTPCLGSDKPQREFDFWIGTWDVYVGDRQAGVNVIEPHMNGCVLIENWTNAGGSTGKSFNWIDTSSFHEPTWRQLWVDATGNTLDYYRGRYEDGAMRFEGHTINADGDSIPQRLRFENQAADTVIQVFEQSNDGGATFVETWRGIYVKRRGGAGSR